MIRRIQRIIDICVSFFMPIIQSRWKSTPVVFSLVCENFLAHWKITESYITECLVYGSYFDTIFFVSFFFLCSLKFTSCESPTLFNGSSSFRIRKKCVKNIRKQCVFLYQGRCVCVCIRALDQHDEMSNWLNMAKTNIYIHLSSSTSPSSSMFSILCSDAQINVVCITFGVLRVQCVTCNLVVLHFSTLAPAHTIRHERIIKFDCSMRWNGLCAKRPKISERCENGARSLWDCLLFDYLMQFESIHVGCKHRIPKTPKEKNHQ